MTTMFSWEKDDIKDKETQQEFLKLIQFIENKLRPEFVSVDPYKGSPRPLQAGADPEVYAKTILKDYQNCKRIFTSCNKLRSNDHEMIEVVEFIVYRYSLDIPKYKIIDFVKQFKQMQLSCEKEKRIRKRSMSSERMLDAEFNPKK